MNERTTSLAETSRSDQLFYGYPNSFRFRRLAAGEITETTADSQTHDRVVAAGSLTSSNWIRTALLSTRAGD
jgi:hypothetical protein